MILPVALPQEVTFLFTYAFPYSILTQAEGSQTILKEQYLEPYMLFYPDKEGTLDAGYFDGFSYGDPEYLPKEYFAKEALSIQSPMIEQAIDIIGKKLNEGFYCIAFADEYALPRREATGRFHFVHEFLIYGMEHHRINTIALGENNLLGFPEFSSVEMQQAIFQGKEYLFNREDCPWIKDKYILFLKTCLPSSGSKMKRPGKVDTATKIQHYFNPEIDSEKVNKLFSSGEMIGKIQKKGYPEFYFGADILKAIQNHLNRQKELLRENIVPHFAGNYQRIHFFAEQYAVAFRRAALLLPDYRMDKEVALLKKSAEASEAIRLCYLHAMLPGEDRTTCLRLVEHMLDILSGIS